MTVCFFGHRDTPESVRTELKREIEHLIGEGANHFYVGSQGRFDAMALGCLRELAAYNTGVSYQVVLAYLPKPGEQGNHPEETLFPEGLEFIHPKYALAHRNRWMAEESDAAIVYVAHSWGGAAKYAEMMKKKKKRVINLFVL